MTIPAEPCPTSERIAKPRWAKITLRTLLLLTATISVWLADYVNRRQTGQLQLQIKRLLPIARELDVRDPTELFVIRVEPLHKDDYRWDVQVPRDGFRLAITTRDVQIGNYGEYPAAGDTVVLPAGRCRIVLDHVESERGLQVSVLLNKDVVFDRFQPYAGAVQSAELSTGNHRDSSLGSSGEPTSLLQYSRTDSEPGLGVLLWIEPPKPPRQDWE